MAAFGKGRSSLSPRGFALQQFVPGATSPYSGEYQGEAPPPPPPVPAAAKKKKKKWYKF